MRDKIKPVFEDKNENKIDAIVMRIVTIIIIVVIRRIPIPITMTIKMIMIKRVGYLKFDY